MQSNGKILVGGNFGGIGGQPRSNIARLNPNDTPFDFDGDGRADVSVFRPSNGAWYLNQSQNGFTGVQFGISTDKIVPADYDGDGKTDVAVFRNGTWYLQRSSLGFTGIAFGAADDIPVPADYDGDGKADISVFRPSNGTWYRLNSGNGNQFFAQQFGATGDKPVAADYDGDGKADIAVNRAGIWLSPKKPTRIHRYPVWRRQ
ncbi:MAG: VCBS repeat-containing protein [Pyrinomonadaceae bacterium]|nr:VCBS repeat-containing protein [Pyrinomonadaceae bacterium]